MKVGSELLMIIFFAVIIQLHSTDGYWEHKVGQCLVFLAGVLLIQPEEK